MGKFQAEWQQKYSSNRKILLQRGILFGQRNLVTDQKDEHNKN